MKGVVMGKRDASTLLLGLMLAADPYIQPPPRVGSFVPAQPDYTDYPAGRSVQIVLPSGTLACTAIGVTYGLLKLRCKPLGRVRKGQVLNIGGDTFTVKRVAMASLLLRLETRP